MYSKSVYGLLSILWLALAAPVLAQEVIDSDSVTRLAPAATVEFEDLPGDAGEVVNGRVFVDPTGQWLAVVNQDSQILLFDSRGELLAISDVMMTPDDFPATFIDGAFHKTEPVFVAVHSGGSGYYVTVFGLNGQQTTAQHESDARPVGVWAEAGYVWLEMLPDAADRPAFLMRHPLDDLAIPGESVPNPLAEDDEAMVRIGRLPLPLAVTADGEGMAKRWNLAAGELTASAALPDVPIYGHITPDGRYLLWRDPGSQALHRLDFDSGQDQIVVALDGVYIPFLFIAPDADVVLGVHLDDEPVVIAWTVASRQRLELGPYRRCSRAPDMVVLSENGRTLVIGCDSGLEIWQVSRLTD